MANRRERITIRHNAQEMGQIPSKGPGSKSGANDILRGRIALPLVNNQRSKNGENPNGLTPRVAQLVSEGALEIRPLDFLPRGTIVVKNLPRLVEIMKSSE